MPEQTVVVTGPANVIVVTGAGTLAGYRYAHMGWDLNSGGGGDTSGWDQSAAFEAQQYSDNGMDADDTPCVHTSPIDTPLSAINRHAKAASFALDAHRGTFEYSTIIYDLDGYIGKTPLFTSNQPGHVTINVDAVPPGANIVAVVHNHRETDIDQTFPSTADIEAMDRLIAMAMSGGHHFTVDPFLLFYIFDEASRLTFVYDRDTVRQGSASCHLGSLP